MIDPRYDHPIDTDFQITWSQYGKGVADLVVRWTLKDESSSALPVPDSIYFDFPMRSRLRGGTVLLVSTRETLPIEVKKPAVRFIGGGFHSEAVYIRDPTARAGLMRGGPWRYVVVDERGRLRAEGPLNLPGWEEMERRFMALRAALDKKASAPDTACLIIPNDEEQI